MPLPFNLTKEMLAAEGYLLQRRADIDADPDFLAIYKKTSLFTMTSLERQYALFKAVQHIVKHRIPGDIVECGVWKGGSMMLALETLISLGDTSRNVFLYDTFSGMAEPTNRDVRYNAVDAHKVWESRQSGGINEWCYASLDKVKKNIASVEYPEHKVNFVVGKVEETIPTTAPKQISILRLDTDWYKSTAHELKYLFPLLVKGGMLIIDDYGCWRGAREAVDEYIADNHLDIFLNRIDYTCRIAIK